MICCDHLKKLSTISNVSEIFIIADIVHLFFRIFPQVIAELPRYISMSKK